MRPPHRIQRPDRPTPPDDALSRANLPIPRPANVANALPRGVFRLRRGRRPPPAPILPHQRAKPARRISAASRPSRLTRMMKPAAVWCAERISRCQGGELCPSEGRNAFLPVMRAPPLAARGRPAERKGGRSGRSDPRKAPSEPARWRKGRPQRRTAYGFSIPLAASTGAMSGAARVARKLAALSALEGLEGLGASAPA